MGTKIHLKADLDGQSLAFDLIGGAASDSRQFETLLDIGPDLTLRAALTDNDYDAEANRRAALARDIRPIIPRKSDAANKAAFQRNRVEGWGISAQRLMRSTADLLAWRSAMGGSVSLIERCSTLSDPRQAAKMLHPLPEIVLLLLCATLAGADDFVEVQIWGEQNLAFLRRLLSYAHGVSSHDMLGDVVAMLDPALFKACFTSGPFQVITHPRSGTQRSRSDGL